MVEPEEPLEPGSTKHSPRLDDQLHHEVEESHTRDDLRKEDPAGHPGNRPRHPGTPPGLSAADVELRSQLAGSLRPSVFPGDRSKLLATARHEHAPPDAVSLIESLPDGITWKSVQQVGEQAGGPRGGRRSAGA